MLNSKKLVEVIEMIARRTWKFLNSTIQNLFNWLSRRLFRLGRRRRLANSGFVLPTVAMVTLVVVLLSAALVTRSFDRSKNVSNYRVNQENLNAALPALDRARAKINALLDDPELPRGTPSDISLAQVFSKDKFDLPDEDRLLLAFDADDDNNIQSPDGEDINFERSETNIDAWRFPVDTDNNGKFDSFTLYSILFRTPTFDGGDQERERNPLDARALPAASEVEEPLCQALGSAQLVGSSDWAKVGSQLKKSFFIYVATVPITDINENDLGLDNTEQYENYLGNQGFSSLEYQTDIARVPLNNNAVVYEDDLVISAGQGFSLNGRVFTNSNLFLFAPENIELRQVSSPDSCFYEAENAKIIVGGNVAYGRANETTNGGRDVEVHLFQGQGVKPNERVTIARNDRFVTQDSDEIAYNTFAYEERIGALVGEAFNQPEANDPDIVKDAVNAGEDREEELEKYFRERTRRVSFVEFGEGIEADPKEPDLDIQGEGDTLRPNDRIAFPFDPEDGITQRGYGEVELRTRGDNLLPEATAFATLEDRITEEFLGDRVLIGNNLPAKWFDGEVFVGEEEAQAIEDIVWDAPVGEELGRSRKTRVTPLDDLGDIDRDGFWEENAAEEPENKLDGIGGLRVVTSAGFYYPDDDTDKTEIEPSIIDLYDPSVPPLPKNIVWSDSMPVPDVNFLSSGLRVDLDTNNDGISDGDNTNFVMDPPEFRGDGDVNDDRPYLKMRATAVYHYRNLNADIDNDGDGRLEAREPIACVSTFYDPTNRDRARNEFIANSGTLTVAFNSTPERSFNGIVYGPPTFSVALMQQLRIQAAMRHPNGRLVNPVLYSAMESMDINGESIDEISLAEKSAVDAALCSMQIYGQLIGDTGTWGALGSTPGGFILENGTITETAFLDARQIKAIDGVDPDDGDNVFETDYGLGGIGLGTENTTKDLEYSLDAPDLNAQYNLAIEQRQPLEIRATVLNLDLLRSTRAGTTDTPAEPQEYMLPNSGIIYATRDDALPDDSAQKQANLAPDEDPNLPDDGIEPDNISPTDFLLDPTRRPNAIMLTHGTRLGRRDGVGGNTHDFIEHELGLTLVSNLPVYIRADNPDDTDVPGNAGGFNPHEDSNGNRQEEFTVEVNDDNFYDRNRDQLNDNFACRTGDPRLGDGVCMRGDEWRAATVLSDAVTLVSSAFSRKLNPEYPTVPGDKGVYEEGFRTDGGYDLRNNLIDSVQDEDGDGVEDHFNIEQSRLRLGFWNNDFAVNGLSSGNPNFDLNDRDGMGNGNTPYTDQDYINRNFVLNSTYFNNFVTSVQRRADDFPAYVMEICRTLPVSECTADDWVVGYDINNNGTLGDPVGVDINGDGVANASDTEDLIRANQLGQVLAVNVAPAAGYGAGTTAQPPLVATDERYARRVAFARNEFGELILTQALLATPGAQPAQPLGVGCPLDTTGNIPTGNGCAYGGTTAGVNYGLPANNALWFSTTDNNTGLPWLNLSLLADMPLAYEEPDNEQEEFLLPDLSRISNFIGKDEPRFKAAFQLFNGYEYDDLTATTPTNDIDDPADYAICVDGTSAPQGDYLIINIAGTCPGRIGNNAWAAAQELEQISAPQALPATLNIPAGGVYEIPYLPISPNLPISPSNPRLNLLGGPTPATMTLTGDKDSVFVFVASNKTRPLAFANLTLQLNGVDPNNIFWVSESGMAFFGLNELAGNFIGNTANRSPLAFAGANPAIGYPNPSNTFINSGRFLGFTSDIPRAWIVATFVGRVVNGDANDDGIVDPAVDIVNVNATPTLPLVAPAIGTTPILTLRPITSLDQPRLIPTLQIHYIDAGPAAAPISITNIEETNWIPVAGGSNNDPVIFNLALGTGDVPSRPGYSGSNGALENLPRFLESWRTNGGQGIEVQISGSLFQIGRSGYASAPFRFLDASNTGAGGLFGEDQTYERAYDLPHYFAPERNWGFDVGLLSQIPDLFTRRFTTPPVDPPNEFFREPSRDDKWIQTLLCGKVADEDNDGNIVEDFGTNQGNAVNDGQRNGCFGDN